ncbi:hypothetical protein ASG91_06550 [Phycicoccus sp. Soil802]|nr:hypothetical protein ASG91_06550 [Phycicoccus sp. Soil802]
MAAMPRSTPYLRDNADSSSRRSSRLAAARVGLLGARVVVALDVGVAVVVVAVVGLVLVGVVVPEVTAPVAAGGFPAAGSPAQAAATPRGATVSRYRRVSMQAL